MATRIRYLPFEDVVPGMVLGAPLTISEQGVTTFTLPTGHPLTESNLEQIAQRNGEWACIEEADARSAEERAAELLAIRERQDQIFAQADRNQPAIEALYDAVLRYRSL